MARDDCHFSQCLGLITASSLYRDISLQPILSKVLESVVHEQLMVNPDSGKILSDYQFGFRRCRSTEDLLAKAASDSFKCAAILRLLSLR